MKRTHRAITLLLLPLLFISCKESSTKRASSISQVQGQPVQPIDSPVNFDSLLLLISAAQDEILRHPDQQSLSQSLLAVSFDSSDGAFYCVGKATNNPDFPLAAQETARKRASLYIGERWALYLKAWHAGNYIQFGQRISGKIMYSKELHTVTKNDTLYQLILVPLGSVVLDDEN